MQPARHRIETDSQSEQITGAVLNMSHFICPGSDKHHYIFGKPDRFDQVCRELGVPVLGRIPIEAAVSEHGDIGQPVVIAQPTTGDDEFEQSSRSMGSAQAFKELAHAVLAKLSEPTR